MSGDDPLALLRTRRSRPALAAPAPDPDTLRDMLAAAGSAPDHGRLRPWRFVVVDGPALGSLGDAFAAAHAERIPDAHPSELDRSRMKALRAPLVVIVVSAPRLHPKVLVWEQRATAACVAHGLLLAAHTLGFGAMWRTGWVGDAPKVRAHLGLHDGGDDGCLREEVTGWIYLGTPIGPRPVPRPEVEPPVTWLG